MGRRHNASRKMRGRSAVKKLIAALALLPLLPFTYSIATAQNALVTVDRSLEQHNQ